MARILLVDDEASVRTSIETLLRARSHEVVSVPDGEQAAAQFRAEDFDILLTDIRMAPVDGVELMRLAREAKPDMSTIVFSALTSEKAIAAGYAAGCAAYVKKPFTVDDLIGAINRVLDERARRGADTPSGGAG